jgi:phage tail-like protein
MSFVLLPAALAQERTRRFGVETSGPPLDRFAIEIGGNIRGYFTHCSGLGSDSDLIEFREGGSNTVQKLPGNVKYTETLCRRRVTTDTYFWDWRLLVEQAMGNFRRQTYVILYDEKNTEVARWELFDAWPSRSFISETKETKGYAEEVLGLTSRLTSRIR